MVLNAEWLIIWSSVSILEGLSGGKNSGTDCRLGACRLRNPIECFDEGVLDSIGLYKGLSIVDYLLYAFIYHEILLAVR